MKQNSEKRLDDVYMRSFFELITCECCHTGLYKTKTIEYYANSWCFRFVLLDH
jgi:hypothetical protein